MKDNSALLTDSPGRRAASYWFVDGLPEIVFGIMLLIFGAAGLLWGRYAPNPWVRGYFLLVAVGFLVLQWKSRDLLNFLKSRLTYPRTGYVQPPDDFVQPRQTLTLLQLRPAPPPEENVTAFRLRTVWLIWNAFLISVNLGSSGGRWLVPVLMPALAAGLYIGNRNSERPYRWWSVLILALTGPAFLWADVPQRFQPLLQLLLAERRLGVARVIIE